MGLFGCLCVFVCSVLFGGVYGCPCVCVCLVVCLCVWLCVRPFVCACVCLSVICFVKRSNINMCQTVGLVLIFQCDIFSIWVWLCVCMCLCDYKHVCLLYVEVCDC